MRLPGFGAATLAAIGWGMGLVMTKAVVGALPPFTLLTVQLLASVAFLWTAVLIGGHRIPSGVWPAALTGLLEPALAYALVVPGLALTTASSASLIGASEPAMITVLAWALLREPAPLRIVVALSVALAGVVMISASATGGDPGHDALRGDALILAGTAAAALYVVMSSRLVVSVEPLVLVTLQQSVALAAVAGITLGMLAAGVERIDWAGVPASVWLIGVASGVLQYALTFWFYMISLRTLKASAAGFFLTLVPVVGVGGGIILLGERFTPSQWAGCILVLLASVGMAASRAGREQPA